MKKLHLTVLLALCLLPLSRPAFAQELVTRNMARLTLEDSTYVNVLLGVHGENGDFQEKDIYMPEAMLCGTMDATSRQALGKVRLFGHFGYSYEIGKRSTWRGWINPYETPFMLADSIPGDISLERYAMQAGLGLPLGGGWSAGLDLAYDVALMAKHKDLRNKNTGMNFRVAPGIHWQGRHFGAGLDLGYVRGTERVEYSQESSNVEHVLFAIYGMWVGQGYGFGSAETKRLKETDRYFGNFQTDLQLGDVVLHNNFHLSWRRETQSETGYNNLQHGTVRSWIWQDDLSLAVGTAFQAEAGIYWATMQGFRPLQQQELDPDSKIRIWVTYGDPVFCYFNAYQREYLRFTFGPSWKVTVGAENTRLNHAYTEYPQRFDQRFSAVQPYVGLDLPLGQAWQLALQTGYHYSYEEVHDISKWQLAPPLEQQLNFWTGNSVFGQFSACWTRGRMTLGLDYRVDAATAFDGFRHAVSLTAGFAF